MPAEGGEAARVTQKGENLPLESPDGEWLYYVKSCRRGNSISQGENASTEGFEEPACLCRVPASGGEEEEVLDSPGPWSFAVSERGIYFLPRGRNAIEFFRFAGGSVTTVFQPENPSRLSLALSPDGRSLLFTQRDSLKRDLMLAEHFQ
jgi:hypothetical protein